MLLLHNFAGWDICNAGKSFSTKSKFATKIQRLSRYMLCSTLTVDVVVFKKWLKKVSDKTIVPSYHSVLQFHLTPAREEDMEKKVR